jgi:hypothetical protein
MFVYFIWERDGEIYILLGGSAPWVRNILIEVTIAEK